MNDPSRRLEITNEEWELATMFARKRNENATVVSNNQASRQSRYLVRLKGQRTETSPETDQMLAEAAALLEQTFTQDQTESRAFLIEAEARSSAAIEEEFDEERIARHITALTKFLSVSPPTESSLLEAHRTMMKGQPHAQPGQYRTVNVRVGLYRAPEHARVKELTARMFRYTRRTGDHPIAAAAWTHAQFEAIHPFADGNGRTGRAMIQAIIGQPLPVSQWIVERRQQYYSMLEAEWETYLKWFLKGVTETCNRVRAGRL